MTGDKYFFTNLDNVKDGSITFDDGNKTMIYRKGTISASGLLELKDVLFVNGPKAKHISIIQICNDNCLVKLIQKESIKYDTIDNVVVTIVMLEDNCYIIKDSPSLMWNSASLNIEEL